MGPAAQGPGRPLPAWPPAVPAPGGTEAGEGTEPERRMESVALFCGDWGWTEPSPAPLRLPGRKWDGDKVPVAEGMGKVSAEQASQDKGLGVAADPEQQPGGGGLTPGGRAGHPA